VAGFLRLGAEAVGQDLEEAFEAEAEAEGGALYSAGPTAAVEVDGGRYHRYQVALGSGFGLNARSPRAVVRVSVAVNF
jgi:hypothetical protein